MAGKYIQIKVHFKVYLSCVRLIDELNPPDSTFDTILIKKRICLEMFLEKSYKFKTDTLRINTLNNHIGKCSSVIDTRLSCLYSQTCIKRSPLAQRKNGLIRQVTT